MSQLGHLAVSVRRQSGPEGCYAAEPCASCQPPLRVSDSTILEPAKPSDLLLFNCFYTPEVCHPSLFFNVGKANVRRQDLSMMPTHIVTFESTWAGRRRAVGFICCAW